MSHRFFTTIVILALLSLVACQPKKPAPVIQPEVSRPAVAPPPLAPEPTVSEALRRIVAQARASERAEDALAVLDDYIAHAQPALRDEARFRKAQVMLELHVPGAEREAERVLRALPEHPLVPYLYFWLARWWEYQDEPERALAMLRQALEHPALTRSLLDQVLRAGPSISQQVSEQDALAWMISAARLGRGGRKQWLQAASRRAGPEALRALNEAAGEDAALVAELDMYAARRYLLSGDMEMVGRIRTWLETLAPGSEPQRAVERWVSGRVRPAVVGVLLPLTGPYARFGESALRGLRMALTSLDAPVTLRIEDTGSDPDRAVAAYQSLMNAPVDVVVGPLLARTSEALLPYLRPSLPVLSMTSAAHLAARSDALFVHTLAPTVQAQAIAARAIEQGAKRVAVILGEQPGMRREANAFREAFTRMGGEVVAELVLPKDQVDVREPLAMLKMKTDDEMLLAGLDEEAGVFLPPNELEVRMPSTLDAIYLALPGQRVALLASQLAYADLTGMTLYGSSRWMDGHLLDDGGRYLSHARFVGHMMDENQQRRLLRVQQMYREVWGDARAGALTLLAYDTLQIAVMLTSRLGLRGHQIIDALQDRAGFPALTGEVVFDASGVGQKRLGMDMIRHGEIVPTGS
ncbi:MAG: penicillin-binding protein activator [Zetaproteobacteria bacterium]|nr:MAG: penicillin-binding protein activator [Zetaproteobacteria bacterium]